MSRPSKRIVPLVGSSSRIIRRAVVLLPQPVSPTMPSVSPRITSNDTPSTACTAPIWLLEDDPARDREVLDEVADLDQRVAHAVLLLEVDAAARGSRAPCPARSSRPELLARLARQQARDECPFSSGTGSSCGSTRAVALAHVRTARVERAAAGQRDQARRPAGDRDERLVARAVEPRDRSQQPPGVRVLGRIEDHARSAPARRSCPRTSRRSRR